MEYIFTSERLGFRNWQSTDLTFLNELNSNSEVMKYFPKTVSETENIKFIEGMQSMFKVKGYCYFVVEILQTREFMGFIGLALQDYEAAFTPAIDIGWRLLPQYWKKGLATEGAKRVLKFAEKDLKIDNIISVAPVINTGSIEVMLKIGMTHQYNFNHSKLREFKRIEKCSLYSVSL